MPSLSLLSHRLFRVVLLLSFAVSAQADDRKPVSLETVTLSRSQDALLVNGTLVADRAARLSASVSGLVSKLLVDIGDQVEAGAALIELDAELNRLELQRARANYQQQQATLADARRRLEEANSLVARRSIAASEVRSLESEVQVAESSLAASDYEDIRLALKGMGKTREQSQVIYLLSCWLLPVLVAAIGFLFFGALGGLLIAAQSTAIAPFIYAIF